MVGGNILFCFFFSRYTSLLLFSSYLVTVVLLTNVAIRARCSSFTSFIKTNGSRTHINSVSEQLLPHGADPFILLALALYILYADHKYEFSARLSMAFYLAPSNRFEFVVCQGTYFEGKATCVFLDDLFLDLYFFCLKVSW